MLTGTKVGIMHSNYPEELLTMEQLKAIEEHLLDKIVETGLKSNLKPKFLQHHKRPGWLGLTCADEATAKWLLGLQAELKPWQDATLKVVKEADLPHTEILVAYLPNSQDCTNEKILSFIEAQNEGLRATSWRILRRNAVGPMLEVAISADNKSAEVVKKMGYRISYKYGIVQLRPRGSKPETAQTEGEASTSGGSTMQPPTKKATTPMEEARVASDRPLSPKPLKQPKGGSKGKHVPKTAPKQLHKGKRP